MLKKQLIKYFKSLGIEVYTNTKARGHQGFFLKNRIDISKNTTEERIIPTLLHEFAHFIHSKIEPDMVKTGGSLEILFNLPAYRLIDLSTIQKELLLVTNFVDEHSLCHKLKAHKEQIKKKIKTQENIVKQYYPNFMRSKKFKEFDKYIKKSKAKYLLRYDRVKFVSPFLRRIEIYSIDAIEKDFPDMPTAFCAYIRLKSAQKKQARNSARINKLNKYYSKPTELFARLVEYVYINKEKAHDFAPNATQIFLELLESGYYKELKEVFHLIPDLKIDTTGLPLKYSFAHN